MVLTRLGGRLCIQTARMNAAFLRRSRLVIGPDIGPANLLASITQGVTDQTLLHEAERATIHTGVAVHCLSVLHDTFDTLVLNSFHVASSPVGIA